MKSELNLLRRSTLENLVALASQLEANVSRRTLACAAELVEYFTHWRKFKLSQHRTEWIYQPIKRLVEDFMGQFGKYTIANALNLLIEVGVLSRRRNPGNRQDRTYQYRIDIAKLKTGDCKSKIEPSKSNFGQYTQRSNTENQSTAITPIAVGDDLFEELEEVSPPQETGEAFKTASQELATNPTPVEDKGSAAASEAIFDELESVGVSVNPQIESLVLSATAETIANAIAILRAKRRRGDRLVNPAGFFVRAVQGRWRPEPEESRSVAPPGFGQWFDAAKLAGLVTHSTRDNDGTISVLSTEKGWQPFALMAQLYPLNQMFYRKFLERKGKFPVSRPSAG